MAQSINPKIASKNLILAYDVSNPTSFRGEAATNIINSETNAFPKVGNGWGTYNTNQYNNGSFFSIGTVSAVTNNIVTMSAAHPLRTYDVVRPQTTGGGLTANTDYFIRKWTNTTFSVHSYTSSEDGTYGFRALESINNDTRVSINSTNFPTMWWGYPHLPNSGLIKTIIPNGFNGHDCMRWNFHRSDGVTDAMAYGVFLTIASSTTYTYSYWVRAADANAVGKTISWSLHWYAVGYGANLTSVVLTPNWQRVTATVTTPAGSAGNTVCYWWPSAGPMTVDVSEIQCEAKSTASVFTPTSRGGSVATGGGLYDLSRRDNHGELVNSPVSSFSTGSSVLLDGVDDYIQMPTINIGISGTVEIIYKLLNTSHPWGPFWRSDWRERIFPNTITLISQAGTYYNLQGPDNSTNTIYIAYTYDGAFIKSYRNGNYVDGITMDTHITTGSVSYRSGYQCGGAVCTYINMHLYSLKIYDRALSASEIYKSYTSIKNKYKLP